MGAEEGVGVCAATWGKPPRQRSQVNLTLNSDKLGQEEAAEMGTPRVGGRKGYREAAGWTGLWVGIGEMVLQEVTRG